MIKKFAALGAALAASGLALAGATLPAGASQTSSARPASAARPAPVSPSAGPQYTQGAPGYAATDSSGFEQATETTTLVRGDRFTSSYQPFVTLETTSGSPSPEVELIPSTNSPTQTDTWNPNGDIGGVSATKFFWLQPTPYPANSPCAGNGDASGCFYAGETVTLTVYYNAGSDTAYMTIADRANGDEYAASYTFTSPPVLTTAHFGDVWLAAYDNQAFKAPAHPEQLNSFSDVTLTNTSGRTRPLGDWTHSPRIMTSTGTSSGQIEIIPSPLGWDNNSFSLTVK